MPIQANVTNNQITAQVGETQIDVNVSGGFGPSGAAGAAGQAATITVGTVTTGAPGSSASVVNAGSSSAAVLNFTIPAGAAGAAGPQGEQGIQGPAGATGATGPAGTTTWAGITDKPSTFAPTTHQHVAADITDFTSAVIAAAPPTTNASLLTSGTLPDARLSSAIARTSDITAAVANVVNAAPASLDTLAELASALNNDASFASTVTNALAAKASASHVHGNIQNNGKLAGAVSVGSDPNFANVSLLLHFDGSGSTFVDSSDTPKTITAYGNATQSTAQSKFGGASLYTDRSVSGQSGLSTTTFSMGSQWTIEAWVYLASGSSGYRTIFAKRDSSNNGASFAVTDNGYLAAYSSAGSVYQSTLSVPTNQWVHVAWTRDSAGNLRMFVDGTMHNYGQAAFSFESNSTVGYVPFNDSYTESWVGYIDELRVTTNAAPRYTANFTPPAAAFGSESHAPLVVTDSTGLIVPAATIPASTINGLATVATSGSYADLSGAPAAYSLPTASSTVTGGVRIGSGVSIDGSGVISVSTSYAAASHSHGSISNAGTIADQISTSLANPVAFSGLTGSIGRGAWGTTSGTFCQGSDPRLSDARTPTAHNQAWSTITSTPTTLAGYGITDAASASHAHSAADITSGTIATARLATGTADSTTFLRGDSTWQVVSTTPTVASPSQITANQNDYAGATADINRLSSDAARDITGLSGGSSGLTRVLVNVGSNAITLKHQNTGSTAANRIIVPWAGDYILSADGAAVLVYDATTSRWRVI